jgi:hypothetical protein
MAHEVLGKCYHDAAAALRVNVTYTMQSGASFTLSSATRTRIVGDKVDEYYTCMDPSPVAEASWRSTPPSNDLDGAGSGAIEGCRPAEKAQHEIRVVRDQLVPAQPARPTEPANRPRRRDRRAGRPRQDRRRRCVSTT